MGLQASAWVRRWSSLAPAGGTVLDVACGAGRHTRWFAERGHRVTAVDRDAAAMGPLAALAEVVVADIESVPWPFTGRRFDAVVVTNYLWRPLASMLIDSVAAGGVLIWETFAVGNQLHGRPSNADFLLRHGELLEIARGLDVVAYEHGFLESPPRVAQRIAAIRPPADGHRPPAKLREF